MYHHGMIEPHGHFQFCTNDCIIQCGSHLADSTSERLYCRSILIGPCQLVSVFLCKGTDCFCQVKLFSRIKNLAVRFADAVSYILGTPCTGAGEIGGICSQKVFNLSQFLLTASRLYRLGHQINLITCAIPAFCQKIVNGIDRIYNVNFFPFFARNKNKGAVFSL